MHYKITKTQLKQLIKESVKEQLNQNPQELKHKLEVWIADNHHALVSAYKNDPEKTAKVINMAANMSLKEDLSPEELNATVNGTIIGGGGGLLASGFLVDLLPKDLSISLMHAMGDKTASILMALGVGSVGGAALGALAGYLVNAALEARQENQRAKHSLEKSVKSKLNEAGFFNTVKNAVGLNAGSQKQIEATNGLLQRIENQDSQSLVVILKKTLNSVRRKTENASELEPILEPLGEILKNDHAISQVVDMKKSWNFKEFQELNAVVQKYQEQLRNEIGSLKTLMVSGESFFVQPKVQTQSQAQGLQLVRPQNKQANVVNQNKVANLENGLSSFATTISQYIQELKTLSQQLTSKINK